MERNSIILITGCQGMTGSAVLRELVKQGYSNLVCVDRDDCDLIDTQKTNELFNKVKPDYVFHIAAKVGGIYANDTQSADFTYENLMIQCNVIHASYVEKVKKLIFCGSACIYPKLSPQPIIEEYLLTGPLEETNFGYAVAKIAGLTMCRMYRKQYGCNFISVMPTNLYGIGDNFKVNYSHVMPALISKVHKAMVNNDATIEIWGTGIAQREFLYADDLASALIFLMDNYNEAEPVNVGAGKAIMIKELVEIIRNVVGYNGLIVWNNKYPDGVLERKLDVSKLTALGWQAKTELKEGIDKTYKWYVNNYSSLRR